MPEEPEEADFPRTGFLRRAWARLRLRGRNRAEPEESFAGEAPWLVPASPPASPSPRGPLAACAGSSPASAQEPEGASRESGWGEGSNASQGSTACSTFSANAEPEAALACRSRVRLLGGDGRHEEAIALLEEAVEIAPGDAESWAELGQLHYRVTRNFVKSIECCHKALVIDSTLIHAHCTLCLALLQDGRFEAAKEGFLRAIRLVESSRHSGDGYEENQKILLRDCLQELYRAKKEASGRLLDQISSAIELLELEKTCFH